MRIDYARVLKDPQPWPPQLIFSKPLVHTPPSPYCKISVIVPVRNEAQNIETTLTALAHQVDLVGQPFDPRQYEVILLANNCSDDSAAIAQRFAEQHPTLALHVVEMTLPPEQAYIGRVRQILMDEAYRRLMMLGHKRGVIASTDGDTRVASNWIAANLYEIACGVDAVGGRIVTEPEGRRALDPTTRSYHLREVGYRYLIAELESYLDNDPYDPWPRHYQHYGASLAVTAQMYEQVGGLPPVRSPEDVAFYRALVRANARFRHSPMVQVVTSARQTGRAQAGLANQLSEWAVMGRQNLPFLVESAPEIETRLRSRHQLRVLWWQFLNGYQPTFEDVKPLANNLGVTAGWLTNELTQPQTFGLLFERVEQRQQQEGTWKKRWSLIDIKQAISDLRLRLDCLRRESSKSYFSDIL